jgi:hypothetical protein
MQPDEAAVYDICMELAKDHVVSDATFRRRARCSANGRSWTFTVSGVYITLAMLSNTAEDKTPGGKGRPCSRFPRATGSGPAVCAGTVRFTVPCARQARISRTRQEKAQMRLRKL